VPAAADKALVAYDKRPLCKAFCTVIGKEGFLRPSSSRGGEFACSVAGGVAYLKTARVG
jgi:hypothetical protein